MLHEDHVCRRFCHIHRAVHRNADIGRMERWSVIDAVTEITHDMDAPLQGEDDPAFLGGRYTAEEVRLFHPCHERLIIQWLDFCAGKHPCYRESEFCADMLGTNSLSPVMILTRTRSAASPAKTALALSLGG